MFETRPFLALTVRDVFAQMPEVAPVALALGEHRIGDEFVLHGRGQRLLESFRQRLARTRACQFAEHEPGRAARQWRAGPRNMSRHQFERDGGDQLE